MSWNFSKVGVASNVAALKAAIQAESAPKCVKNALCEGVDSAVHNLRHVPDDQRSNVAIVVVSYGHINGVDQASGDVTDASKLFYGNEKIKLRVYTCPLVNTPLPA